MMTNQTPVQSLMKHKKGIIAAVIVATIFFGTILFNSLVTTVEKTTYHIKQAAVTGTMSAHRVPGAYPLFLGDYTVWPMAETYYFTSDKDSEDDDNRDMSVEVRFNDGSVAHISGTVRINMPISNEECVDLVVKEGYTSYDQVASKLILPVLRNALRNSANLMSARESYASLRADYVSWTWDQIQNGVYITVDEVRETIDPISGKTIKKTFKVPAKDSLGNYVYGKNTLGGTGIILSGFEVKKFQYSKSVTKQIKTQQVAYMAVATAIASAKQAEQEKITAKALGEKAVMTARFLKEEESIPKTYSQGRTRLSSPFLLTIQGKKIDQPTGGGGR